MKTVLVFYARANKDAFAACEGEDIKRINEAHHYFHALCLGHVAFANQLIVSYRSVSFDPFAFEISQWDTPVWYVEHEGKLIRASMYPYFDSEGFPHLTSMLDRNRTIVHTTCPEAIQSQLHVDVLPGKHEVLDARSLFYRGRFADAVRTAVTAIEVVLEAEFIKILSQKGFAKSHIRDRLFKTKNDFEGRINEFQLESGRRIPGPILHYLPWINGVRLKSELDWVRKLRHSIVHTGERINILAQPHMQRAIETMTWLFEWLSTENDRTYTLPGAQDFYAALKGNLYTQIEYKANGVVISPLDLGNPDKPIMAEDETEKQYTSSIVGDKTDLELFIKMTLAKLRYKAVDAPPPDQLDALPREYVRLPTAGGRILLVFGFSPDEPFGVASVNSVAARILSETFATSKVYSGLCIINHQATLAVEQREVEKAVPQESDCIAKQCGIALVTASDLMLAVRAFEKYKWPNNAMGLMLIKAGRQGLVPPNLVDIGIVLHYFPKPKALIIRLHEGKSVSKNTILCLRLRGEYLEFPVTSIMLQLQPVDAATGPCEFGVIVSLKRSELREEQTVYLRNDAFDKVP